MYASFSYFIGLTSVTGYVSDVSEIITKLTPQKKTPQKKATRYFDFLVHSKDKVTRAVCFSPQKRPFISSVGQLKNQGIECKKVRLSGANDYLIYSFSELSKVSLNYDKKEYKTEIKPK